MIKIPLTYEIYGIFAFNSSNLSERFLYVQGGGWGGAVLGGGCGMGVGWGGDGG